MAKEFEHVARRKKSDKAKEKRDRGIYSTRHMTVAHTALVTRQATHLDSYSPPALTTDSVESITVQAGDKIGRGEILTEPIPIVSGASALVRLCGISLKDASRLVAGSKLKRIDNAVEEDWSSGSDSDSDY
eukprot:gene9077-10756_t